MPGVRSRARQLVALRMPHACLQGAVWCFPVALLLGRHSWAWERSADLLDTSEARGVTETVPVHKGSV